MNRRKLERRQTLERTLANVYDHLISLVVRAVYNILAVTLLFMVFLIFIGSMLISLSAGLLLALVGSLVIIAGYVWFCVYFSDHRGRMHS